MSDDYVEAKVMREALLKSVTIKNDPRDDQIAALQAKLESAERSCADMLNEAASEYNKKTNDLIERHAAQIAEIQREVCEYRNARFSAHVSALNALVEAMREADTVFQLSGGSTRDYVFDFLLPIMTNKGIIVCNSDTNHDRQDDRNEQPTEPTTRSTGRRRSEQL